MRYLATLIVAACAALALAACGAEPLTLADIPAYPAASALAPGQNPLADSLAETMRSSSGGPDVEVAAYALPADAALEQVEQHYDGALPGAGWAPAAELATSNESFRTRGWRRGSGPSEQVLMIGYLPPALGDPPALIVSLFQATR